MQFPKKVRNVKEKVVCLTSLCGKHANRHVPGHGWLGGSSLCREKSFAQEIGSDRSHNPYHSVHHCTAPGRQGRSRKRRLQTHRKRSVRAQKTSQLKRFKFSVGSGWLERKSCMPNCHQKAFVDNWPTPCRNCTGGEEMKGCYRFAGGRGIRGVGDDVIPGDLSSFRG